MMYPILMYYSGCLEGKYGERRSERPTWRSRHEPGSFRTQIA